MPDYRITIDIKDVGPGDVAGFWDAIETEYGESFDMGRGDFTVSCSVVEGGNPITRFPVNRDDLDT